jgi:hypothetical protein
VTGYEADLEAVEAEHRACLAKIEAKHRARLETWERFTRAKSPWAVVPMGPKGAKRERDRAVEQEQGRHSRALQDLELRRKVLRAGKRQNDKTDSQDKWQGKPIPLETFWELFRLAVEEEASARSLSRLTDESDNGFAFVNRNKTGNIVKWVKAHPARARRALDRHELPREFRATSDGVFPPKL